MQYLNRAEIESLLSLFDSHATTHAAHATPSGTIDSQAGKRDVQLNTSNSASADDLQCLAEFIDEFPSRHRS